MQQQNTRVCLSRSRIVLFALATLFVCLTAAGTGTGNSIAHAAGKTRYANVIVQFGDNDLTIRAITFDTKKITGLDALERTGLAVISVETQFGPAVCSIGGVGMPADDCFGDPQGRYWGYNYWDGDEWVGYQVGAGLSKVKDGAVEGWRWGQFGDPVYPAAPVLTGQKALNWLKEQQSETDGGYGSPGVTADAQLAVGANGLRAKDWKRSDTSPSLFNYQKQNAKRYSKSNAAAAGKLALALVGAHGCFPKKTRLPEFYLNSNSGVYMVGAGPQSLAILGTGAANDPVPDNAHTYLQSLQQPNGAFEWSPGWGTDTNSTALAIQALVASGEPLDSEVMQDATSYLAGAQNADGGFPYDPGASVHESDANSTAWVTQALFAAGQAPFSEEWTHDQNPLDYLAGLQLPDGSLEWQSGSGANLLATAQAIPALLGRPLPLRVDEPKTCK